MTVALPVFANFPGCDSFLAPKAYGFKTPDAINYVLMDTLVHFFSPLDIPAVNSDSVRCPMEGCTGCLKNQNPTATERGAWQKRMRTVVDGRAGKTYMVSRMLVCTITNAHVFQANSNRVMPQYPPFVQDIFRHRFGLSCQKQNYTADFEGRVLEAAASHRSMQSMADEHNGAVYRHKERANLLFVQHQLADSQSRSQRTLDEYFGSASGVNLQLDVRALELEWGPRYRLKTYTTGAIESFDRNTASMSINTFSNFFSSAMVSLRPQLQVALLINVVLYAISLGLDHTFKILLKGAGTDAYSAMLTIRSNASGAIVSFFVESTSMAEVGKQLQNICLLNEALQFDNLKRVAALFEVAQGIDGLSDPLDRFAATYLRHCHIIVPNVNGYKLAEDADIQPFAAQPMTVAYFDNCCQARNTMLASCPRLVQNQTLEKQLEIQPILPALIFIEPLKPKETQLPADVNCGFSFQSPPQRFDDDACAIKSLET